MAYQPLHHKYRPQQFGDLVGQAVIAATLSRAVETQRIAPAYLFAGPHGTGKTSSARILAKSLNCQASEAPTPHPCGQCQSCQAIARDASLDVVEIDAASNTGVDSIRETIEQAQFAPVGSRYKLYIIDEVQMLSVAAFNALLKTLEEPPAHVTFILATTDPQRVLPTVVSRCQRFDFRRIPDAAMVEHLGAIAQQEGIDIRQGGLEAIAQLARGGVRDAESLLDQVSLLSGPIEREQVWELVGAIPEAELLALLRALRSGDAAAALQQCRTLTDRGREPAIALQSLAGLLRDLLAAKAAPDRSELAGVTASSWQALCQEAPFWSTATILAGQQHLQRYQGQVKNATQPQLWLEVTVLSLLSGDSEGTQPAVPSGDRAESPPSDRPNATAPSPAPAVDAPAPQPTEASATVPAPSAVAEADAPEATPEADSAPASAAATTAPAPEPESPSATQESDAVPAAPSPPDSDAELQQLWQQVLEHLQPHATQALVKQHCKLLHCDGQSARVGVRNQNLLKMAQGKKRNLEEAFAAVWPDGVSLSFEVAALEHPSAPPSESAQSQAKPSAEAGPTQVAPVATAAPATDTKRESSPSEAPSAASEPTETADAAEPADALEQATQTLADFFQGEVVALEAPPLAADWEQADTPDASPQPPSDSEQATDSEVPF